jgi:hypothetical protein
MSAAKSAEEIELIQQQQQQQQQTNNMLQANSVVQLTSEQQRQQPQIQPIQPIQPNQSQSQIMSGQQPLMMPQAIEHVQTGQSSLAGAGGLQQQQQQQSQLTQRPQPQYQSQSQLINRSSQAQIQPLQSQPQSQFQPIQQAQQQQRVIHARLINDPYSAMAATYNYRPNLNLTPPIDENELNYITSNSNFNNNTGATSFNPNTMTLRGGGGGTSSLTSGAGASANMSTSARLNTLTAATIGGGLSPTKSMRASTRREELQMYYQKCLRGINHSINIIKATLMRVVFSLHSLIAIFAVYMIKHDEWYLVNFVGVVFLLIELFITIIQRKGKEPRW